MLPRELENNTYAKCFGGRQGVLWLMWSSEMTTPENIITYHNALHLSPQNFA